MAVKFNSKYAVFEEFQSKKLSERPDLAKAIRTTPARVKPSGITVWPLTFKQPVLGSDGKPTDQWEKGVTFAFANPGYKGDTFAIKETVDEETGEVSELIQIC